MTAQPLVEQYTCGRCDKAPAGEGANTISFRGSLIVACWAFFLGAGLLPYGLITSDGRAILVGFLLILGFLAVAGPLWWRITAFASVPPPLPGWRRLSRREARRLRKEIVTELASGSPKLVVLPDDDWQWPPLVRECAHTENVRQNSGRIGADAPAFNGGHGLTNRDPAPRPLGARAGSGADGVDGRTPGPARLGGTA